MSTCSLVPLDTDHLELVRSWILDQELRDLVGTIQPPSDLQHRRWFEAIQSDPARQVRLIRAEPSGEPVGLIGLIDIDLVYRGAELWLYVGEGTRRRSGLGGDATRAMLAFAFDTLGLERVYARVVAYNAAAHALFRACGFSDEGTLRHATFKRGAFHDMHLLSILRDEFPTHGELKDQR
jgi:RimJ/RimL family protein N-acetyltransferase